MIADIQDSLAMKTIQKPHGDQFSSENIDREKDNCVNVIVT